MRRLFDKKYMSYNGAGRWWADQVENAVKDIIRDNIKDMDMVDMENIALSTISTIFCEQRLTRAAKERK